MGKKAKTAAGVAKASLRKLDKTALPPPPVSPEKEVGSSKTLEKPSLPGGTHKVLGGDGYDDGGVADLSLLIDLDDNVQRRRRGEADYFTACKANLLPRASIGPYAGMTRREQKINLAQLLFSEAEASDEKSPSEVYVDQVDGLEDQTTRTRRMNRLQEAKNALRLSLVLREAACASLSLSEICKRRLALFGKAGAEDALRCVDKALEVAGEAFWDGDDVAIESEEVPMPDPKFEKDPTTPGLANPAMLKLLPVRVSNLCMRSALMQRGNALAALGRDDEARETYEKVWPLLENEPRCARVDWERHSVYVNVGNTYSRQGDFEKAEENFERGIAMGQEHCNEPEGSLVDGMHMKIVAKRCRSFALKRAGRDDEAKEVMKEVVGEQLKYNVQFEKKKKEESNAAVADAMKEKLAAEAAAKDMDPATA